MTDIHDPIYRAKVLARVIEEKELELDVMRKEREKLIGKSKPKFKLEPTALFVKIKHSVVEVYRREDNDPVVRATLVDMRGNTRHDVADQEGFAKVARFHTYCEPAFEIGSRFPSFYHVPKETVSIDWVDGTFLESYIERSV